MDRPFAVRFGAPEADFAKLRLETGTRADRKSTRLNSSHSQISYAVFCLKKKKEASDLSRSKIDGSSVHSKKSILYGDNGRGLMTATASNDNRMVGDNMEEKPQGENIMGK